MQVLCAMMWCLLLAGLFAVRAHLPSPGLLSARSLAFHPTPILWGGLAAKKLRVAPKALPSEASFSSGYGGLREMLAIWDLPDESSSNEIPYFTAKPDKTIRWHHTDLCVEASSEKTGATVGLNSCKNEPTQFWNVLPWGARRHQIQMEGTNQCLDVANTEGVWNGALIELQECEKKRSEAWMFEEPAPPWVSDHRTPSSRVLHVMMTVISLVGLSLLSFGAWFLGRPARQIRHETPRGAQLSEETGGVSLSNIPADIHQALLSLSLYSGMRQEHAATHRCITPQEHASPSMPSRIQTEMTPRTIARTTWQESRRDRGDADDHHDLHDHSHASAKSDVTRNEVVAAMVLSPQPVEDDDFKRVDETKIRRRQLLAVGIAAATMVGSANAAFGDVGQNGEIMSPILDSKKIAALDPLSRLEIQGILREEDLEEFMEEYNRPLREGQRAQAEATKTAALAKYKLKGMAKELENTRNEISILKAKLDADPGSRKGDLERILRDTMQARDTLNDKLLGQMVTSIEADQALDKAFKVRLSIERERDIQENIAKRAARLSALSNQPDWFNYVAAFTASCISTLVTYPIDVIKTLKMAQGVDHGDDTTPRPPSPRGVNFGAASMSAVGPDVVGYGQSSSYMERPPVPVLVSGRLTDETPQMNAAMEMPSPPPSPQGFFEYYRGITGALLKNGPPSAIYLGVYEAVKTALLAISGAEDNPFLVYLLAGAVGQAAGSPMRASFEMIKSRVQAGVDPSTDDAIQNVFFDEKGRTALLQAWQSSLFRDLPDAAVRLAVFEGLKNFLVTSPEISLDVNTIASEVLIGAIGGAIAAFLTVPADVITTRVMTQKSGSDKDTLGFLEMSKEVWSEGGVQALFKGWEERTGYMAPAISVFFSCYCLIKQAALDNHLIV